MASDVGPSGAYEDRASWVMVPPEKPGNSNYRRKVGELACREKRDGHHGHRNSMHKQAWLSAPACRGKLEKLKL